MEIIADTHVHLYPGYDLALLLDSAHDNLRRLITPQVATEDWLGVLSLTERAQENIFNDLASEAVSVQGWQFSKRHNTLLATSESGKRLLLCPGFQVATAQRVEVLQLFTTLRTDNGKALGETCTCASGLIVLPWSPGKWLFKRGGVVSRQIEESGSNIFLGDIWLRTDLFGRPKLFDVATERGIRIVAGTDPLLLSGEERRVGQYATVCSWEIDWSDPNASLQEMFRLGELRNVGKRASLVQAGVTMLRQRFGR